MEQILEIKYQKKPCYEIFFAQTFESLVEKLQPFGIEHRKICIITDSNVSNLYSEELSSLLKPHCKQINCFSFQNGEENKTLNTVKDAYTYLIQEKYDRKDLLLALGGGVVGDLCGFVAATYLRGIDFIQVPTTLLSQVDSSIGGKTGVDFDGYKNMVGAFYMPKLVFMNLSVLNTLDDRQFFSGFAEVMKHGLIKDSAFYEWLLTNMYEICEKKPEILAEMVYKSCSIKKAVVEKDPTEQGERALLNFGHTLGHAIEKYKEFTLTHGECVALGCVCAAFISWKHELISADEYYEIRDMFVPFYLPISIEDLEIEKVISLSKSDKKMENGLIKFILLKKIGKAIIDTTVTEEDMRQALQEINISEEDSNE